MALPTSSGTGRPGPRLAPSLAAVALALASTATLAGQAPQTGARSLADIARQQQQAEPPATGVIAGTIVIAGSGQPLDRVEVELSGSAIVGPAIRVEQSGAQIRVRRNQTVHSDDNGNFVFSNLPPGRYELSASRDGYVDVIYGQRQPGAGRSGTPIQLGPGQKLENLTLAIPRGGVITGTVFDDKGRPSVDTSVRISRWSLANGERRLTSVDSSDTDDRGQYRVYGLPPGQYVVHVSEAGDDDADDEARQGYAPVYFPSVLDITSAQAIALGVSEERAGIDLTLRRVPLATVTGRLMFPPGISMNNVRVRLVNAGIDVPGLDTPSARAGRDGTFTFDGVPPGQYRAMAVASVRNVPANTLSMLGVAAAPAARGSDDDDDDNERTQFWAAADVIVAGEPVSGVFLSMRPGVTVSGRVVFQGTSLAPPENVRRVRLTLEPATSGSDAGISSVRANLDNEGRFQLTGVVPGDYRLETSNASGWWAKSAIAGGEDVLDSTLTVSDRGSVTDLTVTMADRSGEVSGVLLNGLSQPVADYTVILAPADERHWVPGSRRIRATRPGTDGLFSFGELPAGDYRLAAITDAEPGQWFDPEFLRRLVTASIAVRLADGERQVQNIRVAGP
jgi:uncharacterized protein (DUF2141 family)